MTRHAVNRRVQEIGGNLEIICGIESRDMSIYFPRIQVINPSRIGVGEICGRVMACNAACYYY